MLWRSHTNSGQTDWDALTVGEVESIPGRVLAEESPEYADLADIQDDVPTLVLNREQTWLKDYIAARARASTDRARQESEERYAVGVGVGLLMLHNAEQETAPSTAPIDPRLQRATQSAVAKAVLSVLPEFDALARETGYDERE